MPNIYKNNINIHVFHQEDLKNHQNISISIW